MGDNGQKMLSKREQKEQANLWEKQKKGRVVVKAGQSWESIAKDIYGDPRMYEELMRANGGINMLKAGQTLRLPWKVKNPYVSKYGAAAQGMATEFDAAGNALNATGVSVLPPGTNLMNPYTRAVYGSGATPGGGTTGAGTPGNPSGVQNNPTGVPNGADRTKDDLSSAKNSYGQPIAKAPFSTPYGMQAGGKSQPVYQPATSDQYRRQAGNKQALNTPSPQQIAGMNQTGAPLSPGGIGSEPRGVYNSGNATYQGVNVQGYNFTAPGAPNPAPFNGSGAGVGTALPGLPIGPQPQAPTPGAPNPQQELQYKSFAANLDAAVTVGADGKPRVDFNKVPVVSKDFVTYFAMSAGATAAEIDAQLRGLGYAKDATGNYVSPASVSNSYGASVGAGNTFNANNQPAESAGLLPAYRPPLYKNSLIPLKRRGGGRQSAPAPQDNNQQQNNQQQNNGGATGQQGQINATWRIGG